MDPVTDSRPRYTIWFPLFIARWRYINPQDLMFTVKVKWIHGFYKVSEILNKLKMCDQIVSHISPHFTIKKWDFDGIRWRLIFFSLPELYCITTQRKQPVVRLKFMFHQMIGPGIGLLNKKVATFHIIEIPRTLLWDIAIYIFAVKALSHECRIYMRNEWPLT